MKQSLFSYIMLSADGSNILIYVTNAFSDEASIL